MLFITNRLIDVVQQGFRASNELSQSLFYGACTDLGNTGRYEHVEPLTGVQFMQALKTHPAKRILLYVHGFNSQPEEDIFPQALKMQKMLNESQTDALVVPIIWPCDNDFGLIKDYWDDQFAAEMSGRIFSRAIGKLMLWQQANAKSPCYKSLSLLAHSMGNRVLLHALKHFATEFGNQGVPILFDHLFLMAADIPNVALEEGEDGFWITQAASHVTCFYASNDFAMPASKVMNVMNKVYTRRLGQTGPRHFIEGVEPMNCSDFNHRFDSPKGHTYFLDPMSPAWRRIVSALRL